MTQLNQDFKPSIQSAVLIPLAPYILRGAPSVSLHKLRVVQSELLGYVKNLVALDSAVRGKALRSKKIDVHGKFDAASVMSDTELER